LSEPKTLGRMETSEIVKRMVEDLRDIIRNEEAWAIGERYKGTIEEQYAQCLKDRAGEGWK
jgi:hypothetical protein